MRNVLRFVIFLVLFMMFGCVSLDSGNSDIIWILQQRLQESGSTGIRADDIEGPWTTVTMYVRNGNGTMTPIVFKNGGKYFIGPKGEYFRELPTKEQIKSYSR